MVDAKGIIEKIKNLTGYTQKEVASEIFGISDKNLSNKIKRGSIDLDALILWSSNENVDMNWLLTGKGEPYLSITSKENKSLKETQTSPKRSSNHSEISDAEIIQQFSDKNYARELNFHLAEMERINSEAFNKVGHYIKGLLDGLRMKSKDCCMFAGPDRRIAERRVKDSTEKFKGSKDRRSGKDRRLAVQG